MADKPNYYSPEAKKARTDELRDLVTKRNDAEERLRKQQERAPPGGPGHPLPDAPGYAKGGQVGKVNPFGMKNSRPDFASGGPQGNRKFNFKKGDM